MKRAAQLVVIAAAVLAVPVFQFTCFAMASPHAAAVLQSVDGTQPMPPYPHLDGTQPMPPYPHFDGTQPMPPYPHFDGTQPMPPYPHLDGTQPMPPYPH
jgi:hypothetical protein